MTPANFASPIEKAAQTNLESLRPAQEEPQTEQKAAGENALGIQKNDPNEATEAAVEVESSKSKTPYISNIGILASSMPYYHKEFMKQRRHDAAQRQAQEAARQQQAQAEAKDDSEPLNPNEAAYFSRLSLDPNPKEQLTPEQNANLQRLKPHSRSTIQLQKLIAQESENPEASATAGKKKEKNLRWQFGIRSRNAPNDAMHAIYRALKAHGAHWEVDPPRRHSDQIYNGPFPVHVAGATHYDDHQLSSSPEKRRSVAHEHNAPLTSSSGRDGYTFQYDDSSVSDEGINPEHIPSGYAPKDPWCIKVRWQKDQMLPPNTLHSHSAQNSQINLPASLSGSIDLDRRRPSVISSSVLSSAAGSATSVPSATGLTRPPSSKDSTDKIERQISQPNDKGKEPEAEHERNYSCYMYMDVQLYQIEPGSFLVDFKCDGYENLTEIPFDDATEEEKSWSRTEKEVETGRGKILRGDGHRVGDKEVSSPQPFLDLTSSLVIYLASGR